MRLTNQLCDAAACDEDKKRSRFTDGHGLYLEVGQNGSKRWFWKYTWGEKEKRLALGRYPIIDVEGARAARDKAKVLRQMGIDPVEQRRSHMPKAAEANIRQVGCATALERIFSYKIAKLSNSFSRATSRYYSGQFGISLLEWRAIIVIRHSPDIGLYELSDRLEADLGNVSRAAKALRNKGLISATPDQIHAKKRELTLTPAGVRVYDEINPIARRREATLLSVLTALEREFLEQILDRLLLQVATVNEDP